MKRNLLLGIVILVTSIAVMAQDKTEMNVTISENGKVILDTIYTYDNLKDAEQTLDVIEAISSAKQVHVHDQMNIDKNGKKVKVHVSEHKNCRGKKTTKVKKEIIVISNEDAESENVEVIIIKKDKDKDEDVEIEVIVKEDKMVKDDKFDNKKPSKKKVHKI